MKTKQFLRTIFLCFTLLTFNYSCDMLEEEEEVEATTTNEKPGYNYTFTCPSGTKSTVPIKKGSEKCQKAQEYFAKIYGCNESDYAMEDTIARERLGCLCDGCREAGGHAGPEGFACKDRPAGVGD
jgi:hypothetical protein